MDPRPIGVLDSGVGGVFVLRKAVQMLPREDFRFLGDLGHAPYGIHTEQEIREIVLNAADILLAKNIKALFIACNTATSAAVELLRQKLLLPVIGVEPALKPAAKENRGGKIAVLATPATLRLPKFEHLLQNCGATDKLIALPCPELSRMVELYGPGSPEIRAYLKGMLGNIEKPESVVLGCTHYSYLKEDIQEILGEIRIYDGAEGAARQLVRVLTEADLLSDGEGSVSFETTGVPDDIPMMERFYEMAGENT